VFSAPIQNLHTADMSFSNYSQLGNYSQLFNCPHSRLLTYKYRWRSIGGEYSQYWIIFTSVVSPTNWYQYQWWGI